MTNRKPKPPCTFDGCGKMQVAKGLCMGHYHQRYRGKPLTPLRSWALSPIVNGERVCRVCKVSKPLSDFHRVGEQYFQTVCKDCFNGRFREERAAKSKSVVIAAEPIEMTL